MEIIKKKIPLKIYLLIILLSHLIWRSLFISLDRNPFKNW